MSSKPKPQPGLVDVIVHVSGSSLDFLEKWRAVLGPYHIIVVASSKLSAPSGLDVEVHTHADAQKLGADLWAIASPEGLSRSYGILLSKKRYVYLLGGRAAQDLA